MESVRTPKGPRQRLILNLGAIDIPKAKHKELAQCIESLLSGQGQLFTADAKIEKLALKAVRSILAKRSRDAALAQACDTTTQNDTPCFQEVDTRSIEAGELRSIGPEYVCHHIWNELGLNDALIACGVPESRLPVLITT